VAGREEATESRAERQHCEEECGGKEARGKFNSGIPSPGSFVGLILKAFSGEQMKNQGDQCEEQEEMN
jgi:hypothetical protein